MIIVQISVANKDLEYLFTDETALFKMIIVQISVANKDLEYLFTDEEALFKMAREISRNITAFHKWGLPCCVVQNVVISPV